MSRQLAAEPASLEDGSIGNGAGPVAVQALTSDLTRDGTSRSVIATGFRRRDFLMRRLLAGADVVALLLALAIAGGMTGAGDALGRLSWGVLTIPVWLVIFNAYGLYRRDAKRVSHTTVDDLPWVFHAVLIGSLLLWAYFRVLPTDQLVLSEIATFGAATMVLVLVLRSAVRRLSRKVLGPERVLMVGDQDTTNLMSKIRAHPEYGLEPVGTLTRHSQNGHALSVPSLDEGAHIDLEKIVEQHNIDRVILSHTELEEARIVDLLRQCRQLCIKISVLPALFDVMGPSVEVDDVEGITVLGIHPPVLLRSERFLKRTLDVTGSFLLIVLGLPLLVAIAIAIKLDTRGPIFFTQDRIGRGGRRFRLVKFRTMVRDAESQRTELLARSKDPHWLYLDDDPRITRVGRILRSTSLDEFPQLWNVLKGEMSLVGPRPLPESDDRMIRGWGRRRLDLTPGISGHWQVLGRTDIPFAEMVKLDYLYVTNWSLWMDIRLILRTMPAVLARKGAH